MKSAYIVATTRTPIGNFAGGLSSVRADDLAAHAIKHLLQKVPHLLPDTIEDLIMGCANQAGEDNRNVARMALLLAGLPYTIAGETVNRLCASGMAATVNAARIIACSDAELVIAGGVEQMTRAPWVISKTSQAFGRDAQMYDSSFGWRFVNPLMEASYGTDSMGMTAENLAERYQIDRLSQDQFAAWSQQKAHQAQKAGYFDAEISPLSIFQKKGDALLFDQDEFLKPHTTVENLAKLRPAFKSNGTVTAGNASGLNDGAAALLLASEKALQQFDLSPIARIVATGVAGVEPRIMGIGPVEASRKALQKAGRNMAEMDIIELNEAFAAQCLACIRQWGLDDKDPRINPNGGAIALGHPLGMSGARIIQTAALQLQRTQKTFALCTMCVGVGQGYAVVLERC